MLGLGQARVIPHGVDHATFSPADVPREPFLLYPADGYPHKNHARLVEAFRRLDSGMRLVLTGNDLDPAWAGGGVEVRGRVGTAELVDLLRRASALVFPSRHEIFGLPPLEAMACGCPVAAANAAGLPEVCGDAAVLFDPESVDAIAAGIAEVLERGPELSAKRGRARGRVHLGCVRAGPRRRVPRARRLGSASMATTQQVPFNDLARASAALRDELEEASNRVIESGWYVLGAEGESFERELARWNTSADAVGCASGTDAIELALRALDVGAGDEVVTQANTCVPTVAGIERAGATAVLCDVEPEGGTMDPASLERVLTPRTRAVIPVHLYGQCADVDAILAVGERDSGVEDCAQAAGAQLRGPSRPARWACSGRSASTRRRTSARSATAARSRRTTGARRAGCASSACTARRAGTTTSPSASTRASTSSRPRSCA